MRRRQVVECVSLFAFQDIITSVIGIFLLIVILLALARAKANEISSQKETSASPESRQLLESIETQITELRRQLAATHEKAASLAVIADGQVERRLAELAGQLERLRLEQSQLFSQHQALSERSESLQDNMTTKKKAMEAQAASVHAQIAEFNEKLMHIDASHLQYYSFSDIGDRQPWLIQVSGSALVMSAHGRKGPVYRVSSQIELVKICRSMDSNANCFVILVKPSGVDNYELLERSIRSTGFRCGIDLIREDITVAEQDMVP